jgi:hypothetical protein
MACTLFIHDEFFLIIKKKQVVIFTREMYQQAPSIRYWKASRVGWKSLFGKQDHLLC